MYHLVTAVSSQKAGPRSTWTALTHESYRLAGRITTKSSEAMSKSVFRLTPAFRQVIKASADKVFGNLPVVTFRTGNKLLARKPLGPLAVNYYTQENKLDREFKRMDPMFKTDLEDRRHLALDKLRRKGKGPPKKGQGKRASKGKK